MNTSEKAIANISTSVSEVNDFTVLGALLMVEEIAQNLVRDDDTFLPHDYGADNVWADLHRDKRQVRLWTSEENPEGTAVISKEALVITVENVNAGLRVHFYKTHSDDPIGYPEHVDTVSVSTPQGVVHSGWVALVERTIRGLFLEIFADAKKLSSKDT